ncbi:Rha family transcriptional regulator [Malikia granosa]|nr:Rha family transcriptional regulator [Malikia granosa]
MSTPVNALNSMRKTLEERADAFQQVEAASPLLTVVDGQATTTSLDIARHFDKRHDDVLRAIRNLLAQLPAERARNFAETLFEVPGPNGAVRQEPVYRITRDGFTLLGMGFTGDRALAFKLAYIDAFNAMEAKLRALYVEPLLDASDKQFRKGIPLRFKLTLQEQGRRAMNDLLNESRPEARRNLYWQLRQVNDALGIPTDSMEVLGVQQPVVDVEREHTSISCKPALSKIDKEIAEIDAYVKKISASKEESISFLQRAGILDKNGELAEPYRN